MALYRLRTVHVTVATAGTPVPMSATSKLVANLAVYAPNTNVQFIYVGDDTVSSATGLPIKPEGAMDVELQNDANGKLMELDLSQIYVDSDNDGNVAVVTYLERD